MAQEAAGWCLPNAQDILIANIAVGAQWYELRLPLTTISYEVGRYDAALKDAKALKIFKPALFYCYKDGQGLHADRVL